MTDPTATRPSLLVRIRDARDDAAWGQFVDVYAPLVYAYARRQGLQDADAADLTQDVLGAVARAAGDFAYDPKRGSFRAWLFTVARNKLRNFVAARGKPGRGSGDPRVQEALLAQPAPENAEAWWEAEHRRRLFAWAVEQVKGDFQESTWQAFWRTAVLGESGKDVAQALGISQAAVYLARGRVTARLREQIAQVEEE